MAKGKEVAAWQEDLKKAAKEVAHNEGSDSSAITISHGLMYYHDLPIPDNNLDVIVIAAVTERCYYDKPYNPDVIESPACFAQNLEPHGLVPHENVLQPQSEACDGCPMAEFGSAKQGRGPACKTYRKLAMVPAGITPEDVPRAEIAYLKVSPTSVKNWQKYAMGLVAQAGVPPWGAVTNIQVVPDKKTIWQVLFSSPRVIDDQDLLPAIHAAIPKGEEQLLRPYTYDDDDAAPAKDSDRY